MHLSTTAQNEAATLVAEWVRENAIGCGAVATEVGRAGCPDAAVVSIAKDGNTACDVNVAVHHNRIVYVLKIGDRIVGGFLPLKEN